MDAERNALFARISEFFGLRGDIKLVGVYGSWASGKATVSSDVDIAVAADHKLTTEERIELSSDLSLALKREVDLVDLRALEGLILREVLTNVEWLKKADSDLLADFVLKQIYDDADFARLREYILNEKRKRFIQS